jgi:TolB-like protein
VIDARYARSDLRQSSTGGVNLENAGGWGERSSLAVLPLVPLGNATDDHGLCLGFADALVSRLGNLQGIDVLPTSAVINLLPETTASDIASRLGVRFVVHGAIQVSKGQWRLSLEVFDKYLQGACFARKRDLYVDRLSDLEDEIAKQIAAALNRPLGPAVAQRRPRYSKDPMAYAEFMRGYRLSSSGDAALLEEAAQRLINAVTRDPAFSLAHAALSFVCATRHFEFDPASM